MVVNDVVRVFFTRQKCMNFMRWGSDGNVIVPHVAKQRIDVAMHGSRVLSVVDYFKTNSSYRVGTKLADTKVASAFL